MELVCTPPVLVSGTATLTVISNVEITVVSVLYTEQYDRVLMCTLRLVLLSLIEEDKYLGCGE